MVSATIASGQGCNPKIKVFGTLKSAEKIRHGQSFLLINNLETMQLLAVSCVSPSVLPVHYSM
jgi:hypothetical protein